MRSKEYWIPDPILAVRATQRQKPFALTFTPTDDVEFPIDLEKPVKNPPRHREKMQTQKEPRPGNEPTIFYL